MSAPFPANFLFRIEGIGPYNFGSTLPVSSLRWIGKTTEY